MTSNAQADANLHGELKLRTNLQVRWGDMDPFNHVNNAVYFRYMEQARIEFFDRLGLNNSGAAEGMILVHAECNFRRPIIYPASIEMRLYAQPPKRSSLPLFIEIVDAAKPEILYADGKSIVAWIDFRRNESQAIPDAVREKIAATKA